MIPFVIVSERGTWGFHAYSYGIVTVIQPQHAHRKGLLAHEAVHCRQFLRGFGIFFAILYLCSANARYKYELEAYREQCKWPEESPEAAASTLSTMYNIGRTYEECLAAITDVR